MVIARDQHVHWGGLMSDGPQQMTIQVVGRNRLRKWNPAQTQLAGEILVHNADVHPGVHKACDCLDPLWQQEAGVNKRPACGGEFGQCAAHQCSPTH